uniref:Alternative protein ZZEF1 n=1 Tax=Homo sapiens TaxID=9606 RepID=L8EAS1_HUMAN|nr:alternative protein ZZEF1 [Homo sapiens]
MGLQIHCHCLWAARCCRVLGAGFTAPRLPADGTPGFPVHGAQVCAPVRK